MNTFLHRRSRLVGMLAVAALLTTACTASRNAVDPLPGTEFRFTDSTALGALIPVADRRRPGDVAGELLDGHGSYSLTSDAGKVVVVNLWSSWCGPCKVETPQFQQVYLDTRDEGVAFVGFDVKDGRQDAQAFVDDNRITYPVVYDFATKVALQIGRLPVAGLPLTVLVDKQGRVAAAYLSIVQPSKLKSALSTLLMES